MKKVMMAGIMILAAAAIISANADRNSAEPDSSYMDDSRADIYGGDMDYAINSIQQDSGGSYLYQESSIYNEPRICSACGGSGLSEFRCTWCDGDGIDPAYEATEGSVLHSFAQRNCAKCSGSGYSSCFYCGGDGIK